MDSIIGILRSVVNWICIAAPILLVSLWALVAGVLNALEITVRAAANDRVITIVEQMNVERSTWQGVWSVLDKVPGLTVEKPRRNPVK